MCARWVSVMVEQDDIIARPTKLTVNKDGECPKRVRVAYRHPADASNALGLLGLSKFRTDRIPPSLDPSASVCY